LALPILIEKLQISLFPQKRNPLNLLDLIKNMIIVVPAGKPAKLFLA
jgi:hypothetical protein